MFEEEKIQKEVRKKAQARGGEPVRDALSHLVTSPQKKVSFG